MAWLRRIGLEKPYCSVSFMNDTVRTEVSILVVIKVLKRNTNETDVSDPSDLTKIA